MISCALLPVSSLLRLFFGREDGGSTFIRNVCELLHYVTSQEIVTAGLLSLHVAFGA
jgi:hypothetical protein